MKICDTHWARMRAELDSLGLGRLGARSGEEAIAALARQLGDREAGGSGEPTDDEWDPLMAMNFAFWSRAGGRRARGDVRGLRLPAVPRARGLRRPLAPGWLRRPRVLARAHHRPGADGRELGQGVRAGDAGGGQAARPGERVVTGARPVDHAALAARRALERAARKIANRARYLRSYARRGAGRSRT